MKIDIPPRDHSETSYVLLEESSAPPGPADTETKVEETGSCEPTGRLPSWITRYLDGPHTKTETYGPVMSMDESLALATFIEGMKHASPEASLLALAAFKESTTHAKLLVLAAFKENARRVPPADFAKDAPYDHQGPLSPLGRPTGVPPSVSTETPPETPLADPTLFLHIAKGTDVILTSRL